MKQNKKQTTNTQKKIKHGEIHMTLDSKVSKYNPTLKQTTKSKASINTKLSKKTTVESNILKVKEDTSLIRPSININFKSIFKDISKEIPKSLLCNICKNLVKSGTKCYQCNALFCQECLYSILNKNKKCPKCFKIISKELLKPLSLEHEFKNTFIKCKYFGCKESINLLNYENHLQNCAFKNIKNDNEIDNLVHFNTMSLEKDPYSNSVLMDYSISKAEKDILLNEKISYINDNDFIENKYADIIEGKNEENPLFKNILDTMNEFNDDVENMDKKKKAVNDEIKELQSKIKIFNMN